MSKRSGLFFGQKSVHGVREFVYSA